MAVSTSSRINGPGGSRATGAQTETEHLVNARCFIDLAQAVSAATRACGLAPPGFQTLPRAGQYGRVLRRSTVGAVVAIRTIGKSPAEVRNDMIDGVVCLQNRLTPQEAAALREHLQGGLTGTRTALSSAELTGPRPLAA
jgi:hypothetical protein